MIRRLIAYFLGCGHFGLVEVPAKALIGIAQCVLRSGHSGEHRYPRPFVAWTPSEAGEAE